MMREKARRPSPLQRRVLIVLAALDAKRPGPVATKDIERVLEQGGDAPVYGPNLRASCRRMEAAGWLRTLRAPNLQLAVELTEAGRGIAEPLFQEAREAETARQRLTDVRRLPLRQTAAGDAVELQLDDGHYTLREAAYVIRLDGTTCLQLTDAGGIRRIKEGDPLQVASWYQICFDAGLPVTVQVNESRD
ncbi:hypothetical protein [Klebsiella pneumoniae]|uniref:hypothetical protein n=1 Tax=Klebsiella pneumoniae TaxID=573 RepID=UPI0005B4E141|nr:hypothetical protein [Klebsiella pneumoniae]HAI5711684.1 hypothetical protein [Escherichia coli]EIX9190868.1 hypothetical protein [Klebsiella pneumoniae]EIY2760870.1 hypothetical protein [Klebsiella pneumoniae]EKV7857394.1 hypothetical protein [Klebsiella pneumoniae]MDE9304626.1 hypothetical protein [Klebsiella pneumoniae]